MYIYMCKWRGQLEREGRKKKGSDTVHLYTDERIPFFLIRAIPGFTYYSFTSALGMYWIGPSFSSLIPWFLFLLSFVHHTFTTGIRNPGAAEPGDRIAKRWAFGFTRNPVSSTRGSLVLLGCWHLQGKRLKQWTMERDAKLWSRCLSQLPGNEDIWWSEELSLPQQLLHPYSSKTACI